MTQQLTSPFVENKTAQQEDQELCIQAIAGDFRALTALVRRHQQWIYNLALRLVLSPADAEDLAQEAWVRIVTRLSQFQGRSAFRTWAYRIVTNLFLDGKRRKLEQSITSFDAYGKELDSLPMEPLNLAPTAEPYQHLIVEEAKVGCMLAMLLCLNREQRLAYVLGEIFEAPSALAAEILEITPAAFRKRLERARRDLINFMNEKCGLLNQANPCRCSRKTQAFIREGWVDPVQLKFTDIHVARLKQKAEVGAEAFDQLAEARYATLFRSHPIVEGPDFAASLKELLCDPMLAKKFGLQ